MGITRSDLHKRRATGGRKHIFRKKRKHELGRPPAATKLVEGEKRVHRVRTRGGNTKYRALRLTGGIFSWGSENSARHARILDVVYNHTNNELVRTKTLVKGCIVQIDGTPFRTWYYKWYGVHLCKPKEVQKELRKQEAIAAKKKRGQKKAEPEEAPKPVKKGTKEGKKSDKKAEEKKAEDKKASDKKASDKKAGDKKGADKKAGDKKAGDKKAGDKKESGKEVKQEDKKASTEGEKEGQKKKGKKGGKKKKHKRVYKSHLRKCEKRRKQKGFGIEPALREQLSQPLCKLLAKISSRPGQDGRANGYILEGAELEFYQKKLEKKKHKK